MSSLTRDTCGQTLRLADTRAADAPGAAMPVRPAHRCLRLFSGIGEQPGACAKHQPRRHHPHAQEALLAMGASAIQRQHKRSMVGREFVFLIGNARLYPAALQDVLERLREQDVVDLVSLALERTSNACRRRPR